MKESDYKLGLYEKALPDFTSWEEKLLLTAQCGFDWMELSVDESEKKLERLLCKPELLAALCSAQKNTGVHIRTMCLSGHRKFPLGSRDPAVRLRSMDVMQRAIALSAQAGISLIQLAGYDVYYEEHGEDTREYFCDGLAQAVELAAATGVSMGFETMETPFMDTVEKSMVYVRQIRSPYLGIYPDIGNLQNAACLYGREAVHDLRTGAGHIFAAHLKETAPGIYRDMQFGTTGHTKYVPCIRELWRQGVRIYTGECWYHGEENYRDRLQSASAFLRSKITEARQTIESKEK